jgi:hypothetical protein
MEQGILYLSILACIILIWVALRRDLPTTYGDSGRDQLKNLASKVIFALSINNFNAVFSRISGRLQVPTEYMFYYKRAILFLSSSKILTTHTPLRPANLSSHRNKGGGTHSTGGEGDGGSIFWKTREIGLLCYSKICTLCTVCRSPSLSLCPPSKQRTM